MTGTSDPSRIARQVSRPPIPGMFMSSRTRLGISCGSLLQRIFAGARLNHFVIVAHQRGLHHAADLRIVVHHQNLAGAQLSRPPRTGSEK